MDPTIIEMVNVSREVAWLPWAVQYFFLIGLSIGALLIALPGTLFGLPRWQRVSAIALLVALITGLAAPVALLADLHQPFRFYHFYLYPQTSSWMAWGAFFLPAYVLLLVMHAWLVYRPALSEQAETGPRLLSGLFRRLGGEARPRLQQASGLAALLAALAVLTYTGMELAVVAARPLWHTPLLPWQLFATALVGAAGMALLLQRLLVGAGDADTVRHLQRLLIGSAIGVAAIGLLWLFLGFSGTSPSYQQAITQLTRNPGWQLNAAWTALALVAPVAAAWLLPRHGWLSGLLALHFAWMFRWSVFMDVQSLPKAAAGYQPYVLPFGTDGLLGIVGTAGLVVFLVLVLSSLLPWQRPALPALSHHAPATLPGHRPEEV